MVAILAYQLAIVITLAVVRVVAPRRLLGASLIWTALTVINLFWPPLIALQLIVIWVTYSALTPSAPSPRQTEPAIKVARKRQAIDLGISMPEHVAKAPEQAVLRNKAEAEIREFLGNDPEREALFRAAQHDLDKVIASALAEFDDVSEEIRSYATRARDAAAVRRVKAHLEIRKFINNDPEREALMAAATSKLDKVIAADLAQGRFAMGDWEDIGAGINAQSVINSINGSNRQEERERQEDTATTFSSYRDALEWARRNPGAAIARVPGTEKWTAKRAATRGGGFPKSAGGLVRPHVPSSPVFDVRSEVQRWVSEFEEFLEMARDARTSLRELHDYNDLSDDVDEAGHEVDGCLAALAVLRALDLPATITSDESKARAIEALDKPSGQSRHEAFLQPFTWAKAVVRGDASQYWNAYHPRKRAR